MIITSGSGYVVGCAPGVKSLGDDGPAGVEDHGTDQGVRAPDAAGGQVQRPHHCCRDRIAVIRNRVVEHRVLRGRHESPP